MNVQGFGVVWRYKDAKNYYVTRCNALEDNCTIYHVVDGRRRAFLSRHIKTAGLRRERLYVAAKCNANFPENPARHRLPTIQGVIVLLDGERGVLLMGLGVRLALERR